MRFDGEGIGVVIPRRHDIPHYHGDSVRWLFLLGALILIVAQSTGADLPISTTTAVVSAIILVVAAGITNPSQTRIHWFNAIIAVIGSLVFGDSAVVHYRAGVSVFEPSFAYVEALTIVSLLALYYATRTIRGFLQRSEPH